MKLSRFFVRDKPSRKIKEARAWDIVNINAVTQTKEEKKYLNNNYERHHPHR